MSDLLREIRSAQIRAGEGAVCDRLRKLGLIAEKVADVQRPLTALKIAAALHDGACPSYVRLDAAEMIRQQHAEIEWLKRERKHIYDLLARIHRDGGQYTAEHGVEKSCDDAEAQVVTWLDLLNSVDALIEQARIAEREACAAVCIAQADRLEGPSDACGIALVCAGLIRARAKL